MQLIKMNAIIIAAGSGKRISNHMKNTPKSLIEINGKSIINYQIDAIKKNGITNIIVITGKYSEKFSALMDDDIHYVNDVDHEKHDILGSLMEGKEFLKNDVLVLYSDIIFEEKILRQILDSKKDISLAIDMKWRNNYEGRTEHPQSEAENVLLDKKNKIIKIRKNIENDHDRVGEFLGIIKFTKIGAELFVKKYEELVKEHKVGFHNAPSIMEAYLTDMLQELIDCELKLEPVFISGKWCEIDTMQDLKVAERKF
tara:strand:- start:22367 stop:23134 length:768 start_codon:yes stop_codon:yes gene_type:complete